MRKHCESKLIEADMREKFAAACFCSLRKFRITQPVHTYCGNMWHAICEDCPTQAGKLVNARGPIFTHNFLDNGYDRIPWHGNAEPHISGPCVCTCCTKATEIGLFVLHEGVEIGFCTSSHYVDWWQSQHDDRTPFDDYFFHLDDDSDDVEQAIPDIEQKVSYEEVNPTRHPRLVPTVEQLQAIEREEREESEQARQRIWEVFLEKNPEAAAKFGITKENARARRISDSQGDIEEPK